MEPETSDRNYIKKSKKSPKGEEIRGLIILE